MKDPRHRVSVTPRLVTALAEVTVDSHGLASARSLLRTAGNALVAGLTCCLEQDGWVIAALPPALPDRQARRAAAGLVSGFGTPFFSLTGGHGLRLDGVPGHEQDPVSFGGFAVRIDNPASGSPSDRIALLMLRPDRAGGRCSAVSDLRATVALLDDVEHDVLPSQAFFAGRAEHLHGPGTPMAPFSTIEDGAAADGGWLRWAGRSPFDGRDIEHRSMLERFASLLDLTARRSLLRRGDILITDLPEPRGRLGAVL